jgi:hypothetical protein
MFSGHGADMKRIIISTFITAALFTHAQETSTASAALDKAEVRIPYTELQKLWERAQASTKIKEPEPFPAGALLAAHFKADVSSSKVVLEAEFKAESFAGKWERIRLMGAGLAVSSVEPADARVIVDGDDLCVLAKESGPLNVKLRFVESTLPSSGDTPFLKVTMAPSAVASLELTGTPAGRAVKLANAVLPLNRENKYSIAIPSKGGEVALSLTDAALVPKEEPPPAPPLPSEWSLQNEVLVYEGEGELCHRVRVHAMALNGSALEAVLLLPPNIRAARVTGEDLSESRFTRNADGLTELRLKWTTRDIMERELKLSYALQKLPLAAEWELRAPTLAKEDKVKSLFMFALPPGTEFKAPNLQGPVPAAKLSRWVTEESKAAEFGTIAGGSTVTLQSKLLPRLDTAVAIVTKSEYTTKLISDGSSLTEASLEIEHDDSLRWTFTLPVKSELLKCTLNNAPLKPIALESGVMEIPLSHQSGSKATVSVVSFSYTETKDKLEAVGGQIAMELPLTPIFINEVLWTVLVPETYEATDAAGMEYAGNKPAATINGLRLSKKLCRNERPQAQIFYKKRGIE